MTGDSIKFDLEIRSEECNISSEAKSHVREINDLPCLLVDGYWLHEAPRIMY